jgi:hypothetical protein
MVRTTSIRMVAGVLAAAVLASAPHLRAQSDTEQMARFTGRWVKDGRMISVNGGPWYQFNQQAECGPKVGGGGRCSVPLDKLQPFLHPRMQAWMQFAGLSDERLSGMFECAPTPLPSLLEDGWNVVALSEGLLRIEYGWTSGGFNRLVYMDGRKHSREYNRFTYMGEAIGRFDGDDLVIDTANFTFDTDGLDDHLHLASSMRKHLIERYSLTAPDKLTLTITHEDSLFLRKPFTWALQFRKDARQPTIHDLPAEITPCDRETAYSELELLADKYRGK